MSKQRRKPETPTPKEIMAEHLPSAEEIQAELGSATSLDDIFGKEGIMSRLFARTLEQMLEAELTAKLGYEKYETQGRNSGNSRNGKRSRKIQTSGGEQEIEVPRDRQGEYEPLILEKHKVRSNEIERNVLGLYAKGLTTRDIEESLAEMYGMTVSAGTISTITDQVPPAEDEDRGKAALTELFEEARSGDAPVMVKRIVTDIDVVHFPGWQTTYQPFCSRPRQLGFTVQASVFPEGVRRAADWRYWALKLLLHIFVDCFEYRNFITTKRGAIKVNTIGNVTKTLDTKVLLSTLWIVVMINMLTADILSLYIPGALDELVRFAGGIPIAQLMLGGAIMMEISMAMIILSRVLKYRANRWSNIITSIIAIVYVVGGGSSYPHYIFIATVEVVCLLIIIWTAWQWPNPEQ